jgi:beta-phosphoglucomutase
MISGIIFDLDGVIADTHAIHRCAWRHLLLEKKRKVTEEQLDFILEGRKREEILRHFFGDLLPSELSEFGQRKDDLFYKYSRELRAIPGLPAFLDQVKGAGIRKAVATSASRHRAQFILQKLGLASHFHAVLTGDDVHRGKPDPALFSLAASCLDIAPWQSLVAEDSCSGVRASKSAGMRCLGIGQGSQRSRLIREGADHIVENFEGLSLSALGMLFP